MTDLDRLLAVSPGELNDPAHRLVLADALADAGRTREEERCRNLAEPIALMTGRVYVDQGWLAWQVRLAVARQLPPHPPLSVLHDVDMLHLEHGLVRRPLPADWCLLEAHGQNGITDVIAPCRWLAAAACSVDPDATLSAFHLVTALKAKADDDRDGLPADHFPVVTETDSHVLVETTWGNRWGSAAYYRDSSVDNGLHHFMLFLRRLPDTRLSPP